MSFDINDTISMCAIFMTMESTCLQTESGYNHDDDEISAFGLAASLPRRRPLLLLSQPQ